MRAEGGGIDVGFMERLAEASEALSQTELAALAEQQRRFIAAGGGGGTWQTFVTSGITFGVYLSGHPEQPASLSRRRIDGVALAGVALPYTSWCGVLCREQDLSRADLTGALLVDADFTRTRFTDARLARADFSRSRLVAADFRGADLEGADFENADVRDADFRGAKTAGARWPGAKTDGARFDPGAGPA